MGERVLAFVILSIRNWGWLVPLGCNGFFLYRLCRPFVRIREGKGRRLLLAATMGVSSGMVIWVGDPNLLYTLPVYFTLFFLCTEGDRLGRAAVCAIFFCIEMSVCAILDTYFSFLKDYYEVIIRLMRTAIFGGMWLLLRRRLPEEAVALPRRLWRLVLLLALMPLCALASVVLLTYEKHDHSAVRSLAMKLGIAVLPFVLVTALVLLLAILILAEHERLERAGRLASLRESYYQGLQREQRQLRQLRHDLRNHLTAVQGMLEAGDTERARSYLAQIAGSPALYGSRRLCENETANVVLCAKAEEMARDGLEGDFAVSLPEELPIADTDLCALLGNALDNAMEAARRAEDRTIRVRCRAEKGLFMLRVENALSGEIRAGLETTKADRSEHGFGLAGMREIAARCGGTLEARAKEGRFELVACFPIEGK